MMITDRARRLEELAREVLALRRSQQHAQALARRREVIEQLASRASLASCARRALADLLDESPVVSPAVQTAAIQLSEWRAMLGEDMEAALGGDHFQAVQVAVQRAATDLENDAKVLWQRYTSHVTPETSDDVLTALEGDSEARGAVRRIRLLADALALLRDHQLPSVNHIAEYAAKVAELREAWENLDVASLDAEVVVFLRGANGDRGAPLGLLTAPVIAWLNERGAFSHYVIRPADR
jgi:hypothetical protein